MSNCIVPSDPIAVNHGFPTDLDACPGLYIPCGRSGNPMKIPQCGSSSRFIVCPHSADAFSPPGSTSRAQPFLRRLVARVRRREPLGPRVGAADRWAGGAGHRLCPRPRRRHNARPAGPFGFCFGHVVVVVLFLCAFSGTISCGGRSRGSRALEGDLTENRVRL